MKIQKVLGLDVSKSSVCCHVLEVYPRGGLATYWTKTRTAAIQNYPVFYSNPNKLRRQKGVPEFITYLEVHQPSVAVLEPTGNHYSRLWAKILESVGIKLLWVGHVELKRYREGKNLPGKGKNDAVDALAMAAYPHDPEHETESGELDTRHFLIHQPQPIDLIRDLCQQLEHLARVQSPIINYSRQLLAWQFPEVAHSQSAGTGDYLPPLWGWLAERYDRLSKQGLTVMNRKYSQSVAPNYGIEIEGFTRLHAGWLCDLYDWEDKIDAQLQQLLNDSHFEPYNRVFDEFGFGLRVRMRLLSRLYPFQSFLLPNGKVWIEYEVREVKQAQRERTDGKTIVKYQPGQTKRIKRNRSRDIFKMRMGMGTTLEASGDGWIEKPSGSGICRMSLWQYVLCQVETGRVPDTDIGKTLLACRDNLKANVNSQGQKLLDGKHIQSKLMSKTTSLLFQSLVKAIALG